jgi:hypothetical protein
MGLAGLGGIERELRVRPVEAAMSLPSGETGLIVRTVVTPSGVMARGFPSGRSCT